MLLLFHNYLQVAGYAVATSRVSFAAHGQHHALLYSCRDACLYNLLSCNYTLAVTVAALVLYDSSLAVTLGACGLAVHYAERGTYGAYGASSSVAIGACLGRVAFRSAAITVRTYDVLLQFELLCHTLGNLAQVQSYLYSEVGTAESWLLTLAAASKTSESSEPAESSAAEYVAEHREYVIHVHAAATESACTAIHACMAELVVLRLLLGVLQHAVCLGCLLELLLGLLVARVLVGVVFYSHLAIGLLYLIGCCTLVYAQHFIVVSFCHIV